MENWKDMFPKENRYFETENGILYCGDCIKLMDKFPKNSIDMVFTDPPYGKKYISLYYMSSSVIKDILNENRFVVYYISEYWFSEIFPKILEHLKYFGLIHLHTPGKNPFFFPRNLVVACKTLVVFTKGSCKPYKRIYNYITSPERKTGELHKWQQSIEPAIYLINALSRDNEIVLDPFLGSGTTAVACEKLNRRWIGIEINPEYCEIAKERILEVINQ